MKETIIKHYNQASEAYIDAGMLRENGIECSINGEYASSLVVPMLQDVVTLTVLEADEARARELLNLKTRIDE